MKFMRRISAIVFLGASFAALADVPEIRGPQFFALYAADARATADWYSRAFGVRVYHQFRTPDGGQIILLRGDRLSIEIVQVPGALLTLPVVVYVLATKPTTPAVIFLVWTLVAGLSDNVLKPLMLGRGLEAPMPVILIGVIGGMLADGLLGLFVGPVLLAVAYVLLVEWLQQQRVESGPQIDGPAS